MSLRTVLAHLATARRLWPAVVLSLSHPAAGAVMITDGVDEGIGCFKIVTDSATYFYDKAGAGLSSMLDREGIDWINFRPEGTPGVPDGSSGWFRGIPNMGRDVFGHPGYTGAVSTTSDPHDVPLPKVSVQSTQGEWRVTWEFYPQYAKLTVLGTPRRYWLLYEGTPGGELSSGDLCGRSDGTIMSCDVRWEQDVVNQSGAAVGAEWVYFADEIQDRSLFLLHDDDELTDHYHRMGTMTVFGFGREHQVSRVWRLVSAVLRRLGIAGQNIGLLEAVPAALIIGFVEARDPARVKAQIDAIHHAATGSVVETTP